MALNCIAIVLQALKQQVQLTGGTMFLMFVTRAVEYTDTETSLGASMYCGYEMYHQFATVFVFFFNQQLPLLIAAASINDDVC